MSSSTYSKSDIISDVRVKFPDTSVLSDSRIIRLINFVIQDIVVKTEMPDFEKKSTRLTLSSGTRSYSISTEDPLAVLTVKNTTSDTTLSPITINEAEDWDETETGEPTAYLRYGNTIELYPLPSSDYSDDSIRFRYLGRPSLSTDSSSYTGLPSEYDEPVLKGTFYHCFVLNSEDEAAANAFRQYAGALSGRMAIRAREARYESRIIYPDSQVWHTE